MGWPLIILIVVAALVYVAVRLAITCIAAVVAIRMSLDSGRGVAVHRRGPQDAPPFGPWVPGSGPQDAPRPQDARVDPNARGLQDAPGPAEPSPKAPISPIGRWVSLLVVLRDAGAAAPVGTHGQQQAHVGATPVMEAVPRPTTGPAYLGGRDDGGYLRGWDDGVDWIQQGHPERAPSWSSAAYMTGWNDSIKAMSTARCR